MKLQIALDEMTIEEGIDLCEKVRESVDIIEIGTPFLLAEGMHAVRIFREKFPEKEILADAKIMDVGEGEAKLCFEAGADYVTVLGVTDLLTIQACLETAKKYGKQVVVDMICVSNLESTIEALEAIGIENIAVHTGIDQQAAGRTPLDDLKAMKQCVKKAKIFAAGGISLKTVNEYLEAGADGVIVGGAIAHAKDPAMEAKAISKAMKEYSRGKR